MKSATPSDGTAPPRWLLRALNRFHLLLYRATRGWLGGRAGGHEFCFLTTVGARSGRRRTVALLHIPDGDGVLLVASQGGAERHPAWYHNLLRCADVTVEYAGSKRDLVARELKGEEKQRLWRLCLKSYPAYATYQRRTHREIPVIRCEPK